MNEVAENTDLCRQLQYLVDADILEDGPQGTGERLLARLTSDIRVILLGPEGAGKDYLHDVLAAQTLPQTLVRIADTGHDFLFDDAEICIWCTSGFARCEADQWREAPDRLKDHSFLVPVADPETAAVRHGHAQLDALEDIAAEEFYGLYPIVIGAQTADRRNTVVDELIHEVANIVRLGLAADMDNALMFLKMHQCEKAPEYTYKAALPPPNPPPTSAPALARAPIPAPPLLPYDAGTAMDRNLAFEVYQKAHGTLRNNAARLAPLTAASADAEFSQVLVICQETSAEIADVFSESRLGTPDFCAIKDEIQSAADKILLMSLEGGVAPAIAATTTILQIQRELEVQIVS